MLDFGYTVDSDFFVIYSIYHSLFLIDALKKALTLAPVSMFISYQSYIFHSLTVWYFEHLKEWGFC